MEHSYSKCFNTCINFKVPFMGGGGGVRGFLYFLFVTSESDQNRSELLTGDTSKGICQGVLTTTYSLGKETRHKFISIPAN